MPDHLVDILDEWHKKNGGEIPPCRYNDSKSSRKWKVFDREGRTLQLSKYNILSPCAYSILVLHSPVFPQKLVRPRLGGWTRFGSFLIEWHGVNKGWEAKCCAVRKFAPPSEAIVHSPNSWTYPIADLDPEGKGLGSNNPSKKNNQSVATARTRNPGHERGREKEPEKRKRVNTRLEIPTSSGNASESSAETGAGANESSGAPPSSEEGEDGSVTGRVGKRRRLQQQTSSTLATNAAEVTNAVRVTFELVSYKSGAIRAFPLEKCKTGRDLFDRARKFFRLYDKNVDVTVLSCQPSSQRPHILFGSEDCEGEFEVLIKQAKDSKSTKDGTVTIEVTHVLES